MSKEDLLENFLKKHGISSIHVLGCRMGKFELRIEGIEESDPRYRSLLKGRSSKYKRYFYRWVKGKEIPREIVKFASYIIGCAYEALEYLLYSHYYTSPIRVNEDNISLATENECNIEFEEVISQHRHSKSGGLEVYKKYIMKCLQKSLQSIPVFDTYNCIGDLVEFECLSENCVSRLNQIPDSTRNSVRLEFPEPLKIEDVVEIVISSRFENVHEKDSRFGSTRIRYKTKKLIMDYGPREKNQKIAYLHKYNDTEYLNNQGQKEFIGTVNLNDSFTFRGELPDPLLGVRYEMRWG